MLLITPNPKTPQLNPHFKEKLNLIMKGEFANDEEYEADKDYRSRREQDMLKLEVIKKTQHIERLEKQINSMEYEYSKLSNYYANSSRLTRKLIRIVDEAQLSIEKMPERLIELKKTSRIFKVEKRIASLLKEDVDTYLHPEDKTIQSFKKMRNINAEAISSNCDRLLGKLKEEQKLRQLMHSTNVSHIKSSEKEESQVSVLDNTNTNGTAILDNINNKDMTNEAYKDNNSSLLNNTQLNDVCGDNQEILVDNNLISLNASNISDMCDPEINKVKESLKPDLSELIMNIVSHHDENCHDFEEEYKNLDDSIKQKFTHLVKRQMRVHLTVPYAPTNESSNYKLQHKSHNPPKTEENRTKDISRFDPQPKSEYNIMDHLNGTLQNIEKDTVKDDIILTQQSLETSVYEEQVDHLKKRLSLVVKKLTNEGMKKLGDKQFQNLSNIVLDSVQSTVAEAVDSKEIEEAFNNQIVIAMKDNINQEFQGHIGEKISNAFRGILDVIREKTSNIDQTVFNALEEHIIIWLNETKNMATLKIENEVYETVAKTFKENNNKMKSEMGATYEELSQKNLEIKENYTKTINEAVEAERQTSKLILLNETLSTELQDIDKSRVSHLERSVDMIKKIIEDLSNSGVDTPEELKSELDRVDFDTPMDAVDKITVIIGHLDSIVDNLKSEKKQLKDELIHLEASVRQKLDTIEQLGCFKADMRVKKKDLDEKLDSLNEKMESLFDSMEGKPQVKRIQKLDHFVSEVYTSNKKKRKLSDDRRSQYEDSNFKRLSKLMNTIKKSNQNLDEDPDAINFEEFIKEVFGCLAELPDEQRETLEKNIISAVLHLLDENPEFNSRCLQTEEKLDRNYEFKESPIHKAVRMSQDVSIEQNMDQSHNEQESQSADERLKAIENMLIYLCENMANEDAPAQNAKDTNGASKLDKNSKNLIIKSYQKIVSMLVKVFKFLSKNYLQNLASKPNLYYKAKNRLKIFWDNKPYDYDNDIKRLKVIGDISVLLICFDQCVNDNLKSWKNLLTDLDAMVTVD